VRGDSKTTIRLSQRLERICQGSCRGIRAVGGHDATWPQPADSEQLLAALLELAVRCKLTKGDVDKAVKPDVPI
jgi:hypothetical protein